MVEYDSSGSLHRIATSTPPFVRTYNYSPVELPTLNGACSSISRDKVESPDPPQPSRVTCTLSSSPFRTTFALIFSSTSYLLSVRTTEHPRATAAVKPQTPVPAPSSRAVTCVFLQPTYGSRVAHSRERPESGEAVDTPCKAGTSTFRIRIMLPPARFGVGSTSWRPHSRGWLTLFAEALCGCRQESHMWALLSKSIES